jgi:WD40 repeat protein
MAAAKEIATIDVRTGPVHSVAFSPDGKLLASAGASDDVQLWDVATGKELDPFRGAAHWVRFCAFSPDGKLLAGVGLDDLVRLWDVATRTEIAKLHGHRRRIHFVTFSHDGKMIATAGMDGVVMLWDTPSSVAPVQPRPKATSKGGTAENPEKREHGQVAGEGASAIRSVCQSDISKLCAGEEHVGRCLRQHESELSDSCVAALKKRRENE